MSKKSAIPADPANHLAVFQERTIRRAWHKEEWWFVVTDVVAVLSDSVNPTDYIKKMRLRDKELAQGWGQIVTPLRIETAGGIQQGIRDSDLSLSSILWMKQLAIRLGCQRPQPSRWLSRKRGERSEGGGARQTNRYANFMILKSCKAPLT